MRKNNKIVWIIILFLAASTILFSLASRNSEENVMPYILDAVKSYATLGEICGVMREEFGEYKQTVMI